MPLLVGIDEAGYGPWLGPLVVGASMWRVSDRSAQADLWSLLDDVVTRAKGAQDGRLAVDDSKAVYDRKRGLCTLERPVLAFAHCAGLRCARVSELLESLGVAGADPRPDDDVPAQAPRPGWTGGASYAAALPAAPEPLPWHRGPDGALPLDRERSQYEYIADRLRQVMQRTQAACVLLAARVVSEEQFNRRIEQTDNKSNVVVEQVLDLFRLAARMAGDDDLYVHVDRLGGRWEYRELLRLVFPACGLRELEVTPTRSRYCLTGVGKRWHFSFTVEADRKYLPVSLASMTAKYVREVIMERFNAYWRRFRPSLRPTAGYYSDARRFIRDIRDLLPQAGLAEERFVRCR
jgi:hypothetical protein